MNNIELEKLARKDKVLNKFFIGVFASDTLPIQIPIRPCALIVNTQASNLAGEHWVAMYFDAYGNVDYFDSYGLLPFVPSFDQFMLQNSIHQNHNGHRLQSSDTSVCGLYCLYFLYFRCRNVSLLKLLHIFNWRNFKLNDMIVCKFLACIFKHTHKVCCKIYK